MNRNEARALREERAALHAQRMLLCDAEGRFKTPEDRAKFYAMDAGMNDLKERIDRIEALGWQSKVSLQEGLKMTYQWVEGQLRITP